MVLIYVREKCLCLSAGLLNPLDSPHHMRMDEGAEFREGLVLDRPCKAEKGSYVDCGMRKVCAFLRSFCNLKELLYFVTNCKLCVFACVCFPLYVGGSD